MKEILMAALQLMLWATLVYLLTNRRWFRRDAMLQVERDLSKMPRRVWFFNIPRAELADQLESALAQMHAIQARATSQGNRSLTAAENTELDGLMTRFDGIYAQLNGEVARRASSIQDCEQRLAGLSASSGRSSSPAAPRRGSLPPGTAAGSLREVANNAAFRELSAGRINNSGEIQLPSLPTMLNTLTGDGHELSPLGAGYDVQPQRIDQFYNDPRLALGVLAALPSIPCDGNALEYPKLEDDDDQHREADFQDGEGETKKETDIDPTMVSFKIATIAHWLRSSRQLLDDVPMLQRQIEGLLRYGVLRKAERELVVGTGRIQGLATVASAFSFMAQNPADRIGEASTALMTAGWNPDLVVIHPTDFFAMSSERTIPTGPTDGIGGYVVGGGWAAPADGGIWGMRKAFSVSLTPGTALVLDSRQFAILDRQAATLLASWQGHDNLTRNAVTLLAEIRLGLAAFSPAAILSVGMLRSPA